MLLRRQAAGAATALAVALVLILQPAANAIQIPTAPLAAPPVIGPVNGRVGEPFIMSLCGGVLPQQFEQRNRVFMALCHPPANTFPAGGNGPYSFWTDFGFPPFGIHLQLNGILSGVPRVAGVYNVPVAVKDLGGNRARILVIINVQPRAVPPPPAPPPPPLPPPTPPPVEADIPEPPMIAPLLRQPDRGGPYTPPCTPENVLKAREDADSLSRGLRVQREAMDALKPKIEAAKNESRQKRQETRDQFVKYLFAELQGLARSFTVIKKAVEDATSGLTQTPEQRQQMQQLTLAEADWLRFANSPLPSNPESAVESLNKMTRNTHELLTFVEKHMLDPVAKELLKRLVGGLAGTVWRTARLAIENTITTQMMFDSQQQYLELQNSYDAIKWHYDRLEARALALQKFVSDCPPDAPRPQQARTRPPAPPPPPKQKVNTGDTLAQILLWTSVGVTAGFAGIYLSEMSAAEESKPKNCGSQPQQPSAFASNYTTLFNQYISAMGDWCRCNGFSTFSGGACR